jgi:tagaturonate epimerase
MDKVFAALRNILEPGKPVTELIQHTQDLPANGPIYPQSVASLKKSLVFMARGDNQKFLVELAGTSDDLSGAFAGDQMEWGGMVARKCPLLAENAQALRANLAWTAPVSLRDRRTTIGLGDRLGRASAGHVRALKRFKAAPVLAQQSMRELALTSRTFQHVVNDTTFMVFQEGFSQGYGADGDHLKNIADINKALDAGMTMITLDLTEVMRAEVADWSEAQVTAAWEALPAEDRDRITTRFADKDYNFEGVNFHISALEAHRSAVMYGPAIEFTKEVYQHLKSRRGDSFDLELSIDETTTPTLPAHHLFIVTELKQRGVVLNSLAPRFIGDFQKGIDYIGDIEEFTTQFRCHCAIARAYGNYKISVHSGSDKFSIFPLVGRHTRNRFHLKTSGTSWLEALRVIASADPALFREALTATHAGLADALKLYHITADFKKIPALDTLTDAELPGLLDLNEARQLLHISYGTLLQNADIGPNLMIAMFANEDKYYEALVNHIGKHLTALGLEKRAQN